MRTLVFSALVALSAVSANAAEAKSTTAASGGDRTVRMSSAVPADTQRYRELQARHDQLEQVAVSVAMKYGLTAEQAAKMLKEIRAAVHQALVEQSQADKAAKANSLMKGTSK